MGHRLVPLLSLALVALVALAAEGCGKEIGDSCVIATDCSPNGDRICDTLSKDGYCTVQGCDYSTCPSEAACVRFFTGSFSNKTCDPAMPPDACSTSPTNCCSLDEICAVSGQCVPHASEVRYCMRKCNSDGDCRDGYECRDIAKMIADGGEPVPSPGQLIDGSGSTTQVVGRVQKFCAMRPAAP